MDSRQPFKTKVLKFIRIFFYNLNKLKFSNSFIKRFLGVNRKGSYLLISLLGFLLCVILALIIISVLYSQELKKMSSTEKSLVFLNTTSSNLTNRNIPFASNMVSNEVFIPPEKQITLTSMMPIIQQPENMITNKIN